MLLQYALVNALAFPVVAALDKGGAITGVTCINFPDSYTYSRSKVMLLRGDGSCEMEQYTTTGPLAPLKDPVGSLLIDQRQIMLIL